LKYHVFCRSQRLALAAGGGTQRSGVGCNPLMGAIVLTKYTPIEMLSGDPGETPMIMPLSWPRTWAGQGSPTIFS